MPDPIRNANALWAGLIVEALRRGGIEMFFIAPGSRSTPLTTAAARNTRVNTQVHFDERGLAFGAVGYARATGRPAALICTSGTAGANFLPAVVEASNAGVPLIVLTADRPPELQGVGANQTIDQERLYGAHVRAYFALPTPSPDEAPACVLNTVADAVRHACVAPPGPVHINCPFREPLEFAPEAGVEELHLELLSLWRPVPQPTPHADLAVPPLDPQRGLLVVGRLRDETEREAVRQLAQTLQWPVFADITSGLRLGHAEPPFAPFHDHALLVEEAFVAPDAILHLGGAFTSKRLLTWLGRVRPQTYVHADADPRTLDPNHQVTHRLRGPLPALCAALADAAQPCRDVAWSRAVFDASRCVGNSMRELDTTSELSEPAVARAVSRMLPGEHVLFLGNSMPIRDMDMFAVADGKRAPVHANRGASGIDGCISTAAGLALGARRPVTAILGDLSTLHDLNALAWIARERLPVTLIVINNDGGGIFHFLPIAQQADVFEPFFVTPHGLRFEKAAELFAIPYDRPQTLAEFREAYGRAAGSGGPALIEIPSNREANAAVHAARRRAVQESGPR